MLMFIRLSMLCSLTWHGHCYLSPPNPRRQQDALLFFNMAWTLLYIATKFEKTARPIMNFDNILSFFDAMPCRSLIHNRKQKKNKNHRSKYFLVKFSNKIATHASVMAAGKIKPRQTAAVAPVNSKASQMFGMKVAPKNTTQISPRLVNVNLKLFKAKGPADGKRSPSKFNLNGKKTTGNTSIKCAT